MIGGITNSNIFQAQALREFQQMKSAFQQLGSDLQAGNPVAPAQPDSPRTVPQAHVPHQLYPSPVDSESTTSGDPLSLFTNLAASAATAYGRAGLSGALTAGSLLSQLI